MTRRQALGQHFLRSKKALNQIIEAIAPQPEDLIMEIGAGKGALTFPLARRCGQVIAIEKDTKLIPFLTEKSLPNLSVIQGDILRLDWEKLLAPYQPWKGPVKLAGNLPYSISSPLLFRVLEKRTLFSLIVFLLQREVAARVCAPPGSKDYAPLSIFFNIFFETNLVRVFPPHVFSPPPQVQSALITLRPRPQPLYRIQDWPRFQDFLRGCFRHRRKLLVNNLRRLGYEEKKINEALTAAQLSPAVRPEQVAEAAFIDLFHYLQGEAKHP